MKLFPLATTQLANSFRIWTRVAFVFGVFLYALMLQKFYAIYGPLFTYLGMVYEPQDDYIYIFAMSIAMFIATILPLDYKKPSVIFLHLLFIMSYIPINVVYSLNKYASTSALLAYSLFFVIFSVTYLISLPSFKIKKNFINQRVFFGLIWLIIFISLFFLVMKYGTNVNVKSFDDIYETRDAFKEETAGSRFYVVIFNWLSHVFAIFLLLYAIYRKHFIFIILAFAIQLYLFNLGGNKSIFLFPFFALFIYYMLAFFKAYSPVAIIYAFVILTLGLYLFDLYIYNGYSMLSSILIRRNFFVPANLFFHYIDYFSVNPKDFMAKSFPFNLFYDSYYTQQVQLTIGKEYINKYGNVYANANVFADLFANLGYLGFLVAFGFLFFISKWVDYFADGKNYLIVVPIFAVTIVSIINSGLIVNLFTYGLVLIMLLITYYPKEKSYILK